jgi:four helix bundle protein
MIIKSLDDLQVLQLAQAAADEISAILKRPCFQSDTELRNQIAESSASIPAKISEGFGQGSDRHCAHYQRIARGSSNEVVTHLAVARGRGYISDNERQQLKEQYEVIGKKLTRWIQHLAREDRKARG